MSAGWEPVADGLWRYVDTCCVYALVADGRALLIDFGSGAALEHLDQLGVAQVDAVWFTHAHRDQCQGVGEALPLHFPALAEGWMAAHARPDFNLPSPCHWRYPWPFKPPHPVSSATFDLVPGQWVQWGPWDLELFAAPGHCDHQLAILADGPGGLTLFCGDALAGPGVVHEAFQLENDHYTGGGARIAATALAALRNLKPDRVCPSHGAVIEDGWGESQLGPHPACGHLLPRGEGHVIHGSTRLTAERKARLLPSGEGGRRPDEGQIATTSAVDSAFTTTIARLLTLADLKDTCVRGRPAVQRLCRPVPNTFVRVSEHLWLWNNSYFLRSDDGAVLMVDADTDQGDAFWGPFADTFGDAALEVVLVSHIHCDHVAGIEPARLRHPRLQCWALDYLVPGIEQPESLPRPWMHDTPARVDRSLADGETVRWHEYELQAFWYPAQTDFHALYATTIDGHRALFSGDNFYPAQQWGGTGGLCGFNGGDPALWRRSAELTMRLEPDWMLASHRHPFVYRREDFDAVVAWSHEVEAAMAALSPDGCVRRHCDPNLFEARPYCQRPGRSMTVQLVFTNPYQRTLHVAVQPVPGAWLAVSPTSAAREVAPGERAVWHWALAGGSTGVPPVEPIGETPMPPAAMLTFDITVDGERWGQLAECYVRGA